MRVKTAATEMLLAWRLPNSLRTLTGCSNTVQDINLAMEGL
jgi:hypothetical protein